jgi:hypothetical protein
MRNIRTILSIASVFYISGCTSITVDPVPVEQGVTHVCIKENPKVIRADFLPTLERGFQRYGISTEVYERKSPENCEVFVTYTATQTWDMAMVLKDAEVWVKKSGKQIAYGNYHLRAGGGFSLMKWQGAEKKIQPMMDELLVEYK